MSYLKWDPYNYSIGIPAMDEQHQHLVRLIDDLYNAMHAGEGRKALQRILDGLYSYTEYHFKAEERLMAMHGFPEYESHKGIHRKMTRNVIKIRESFEKGEISSPVQISNFLKNWLTQHIMQTDRRYGDFIIRQGIARPGDPEKNRT